MNKKNFFKTVLAVCLMTVCWMPMLAQSTDVSGDVNNDGRVNITDVTILISNVLSESVSDSTFVAIADMNEDGVLNITDVTILINIILKGEEHEYVDLGLPSGTLWATCNIGASKPSEFGSYFAWGETAPKSRYDSSTYHGHDPWKPENDAAYVNWGSSWRMPTFAQLNELKEQCIWTPMRLDGTNGNLVKGPNGNTLFLPAAGGRSGSSSSYVGLEGRYWSTRSHSNGVDAYYLTFKYTSLYVNMTFAGQVYGNSIRPVYVPE